MPNEMSFTAAGVFPYKIFRNEDVVGSIINGIIPPAHLQVIPTNRCNLSCGFCSCKDRNRKQEIDLADLCVALYKASNLGTKSITITGGGEPLMYDRLDEVIAFSELNGIKVGLVTNGLLLGKLDSESLRKLTWCRISFSDERDTDGFEEIVKEAVSKAPEVDWAFSYVVTRNYDKDKLSFIVDMANRLNFTHVRVVSDLIDLEGSEPMDMVRASLRGMDTSRVIYQPRQNYSRGSSRCYISLLKPVLGADGYAYPCCGAQYAIDGERLDLVERMRMGSINDLPDIFVNQSFFDGSVCDRCYYKEYNDALGAMLSPMKHTEFV